MDLEEECSFCKGTQKVPHTNKVCYNCKQGKVLTNDGCVLVNFLQKWLLTDLEDRVRCLESRVSEMEREPLSYH